MRPPYTTTSTIIKLIADISELLGRISSIHLNRPPTELRKRNRIKTIQSSLEIEGNTLTEEQITLLMDNKKVFGPRKDILEVQNAINVYSSINEFDYKSQKSLLKAHKKLMKGLIDEPGNYRSGLVGIVKGSKVTHVAPPSKMVPQLMKDLFDYLERDSDLLLLKSCVFHYEIEFIHPFQDGNGRIGRLWQTLILIQINSVFEFLPIEYLIKERQNQYYLSLQKSDKNGNSTVFIEFMLQIIRDSLDELLSTENRTLNAEERISIFKNEIGDKEFTRKDYLKKFKEISAPTASRDIKRALELNLIQKAGDKNTSRYKFKL